MSYTDRLLSSGERIVHQDRQHWFVVLANGRYGVFAILGALLLVIVEAVVQPDPSVSNALGAAAAILFILGLAILVWEVLRYQNQTYVITNRRVLQVNGVINKHSGDSSLEKINDADLTQSVLGRMFNFGDLDVLTASDQGIDRMRMIHDPVGFKRTMLDAKHEYEIDVSRGPMPVSPPLRAGGSVRSPEAGVHHDPDATSAHAVPAQAAVPAPPAPSAQVGPADQDPPSHPASPAHVMPRMSPDEVTRTLASLADLRDRGVISPQEFDEKKAELLARL